MFAARPSGWLEEASITASSRGDTRKSSPPQYICCSCKINCTWSTGFLEPAGDSVSGSSHMRGRNQHEYTSKLKNTWKSMFGKRSCHKVLNSSSERIPRFEWKTPGEHYQWNTTSAVNPVHLLCSHYTVTWNCLSTDSDEYSTTSYWVYNRWRQKKKIYSLVSSQSSAQVSEQNHAHTFNRTLFLQQQAVHLSHH